MTATNLYLSTELREGQLECLCRGMGERDGPPTRKPAVAVRGTQLTVGGVGWGGGEQMCVKLTPPAPPQIISLRSRSSRDQGWPPFNGPDNPQENPASGQVCRVPGGGGPD